MKDIRKAIKTRRLFFDGGMGTLLQQLGLKDGQPPELWNASHPDIITKVHKSYIDAGSDIITANTFGINPDKYPEYESMIQAAMKCARDAADSAEKQVYTALDIGPTGRLTEPLGDLRFEEAVSLFSRTIRAGVKCGADLILIETMNDCLETKAAVIAAKECCDLPIFVTNAYDASGKLMTGADPKTMVAMLESLGVDAVGMNCSFGPDIMLKMTPEFAGMSEIPLIANPNAGLPKVSDGKTVYDVGADEFAQYMVGLAKEGFTILGGCCGTTPEYIKKTVSAISEANIPFNPPEKKDITAVTSGIKCVCIGDSPIMIGERINPTGKPKLKAALREENLSYILNEAVEQAEAHAHILDVNVGLPEIDERAMLCKVVSAVQSVTDLPLQLDSADPSALEGAMRIYCGKPLINSVNGEKEKMDALFPLVKKYGGALIALAMDETGIPNTAAERVAIIEKIISEAGKYGIEKKDIIADPLCLTVSSDQKSALVTLEAVRMLRERGIKTSLGVSNISFGLPEREKINACFYGCALENGLDCAIMNPRSKAMTDVYYAFKALHGMDSACADYISYAQRDASVQNDTPAPAQKTLSSAIVKGLKDDAAALADELLKDTPPLDVINLHIIPALNEIGSQFEQKKAFLPQLLMSADAATAAFSRVKLHMPQGRSNGKDVILATVKGDIHDIGKNIVRVMLESYGFKVYDLGRDVDPQAVLDCVKKTSCKLVGLSALMTTTVPSMEKTIALLHEYDKDIKVVVGGAVLTREYAEMIHADSYAKDAMDTVRYAESYYNHS